MTTTASTLSTSPDTSSDTECASANQNTGVKRQVAVSRLVQFRRIPHLRTSRSPSHTLTPSGDPQVVPTPPACPHGRNRHEQPRGRYRFHRRCHRQRYALTHPPRCRACLGNHISACTSRDVHVEVAAKEELRLVDHLGHTIGHHRCRRGEKIIGASVEVVVTSEVDPALEVNAMLCDSTAHLQEQRALLAGLTSALGLEALALWRQCHLHPLSGMPHGMSTCHPSRIGRVP